MSIPPLLARATRIFEQPGDYYVGASIRLEPHSGTWLCLGPFRGDPAMARDYVSTVRACYQANDRTGTHEQMVFSVIRLDFSKALPTAFALGDKGEVMLNHEGDADAKR